MYSAAAGPRLGALFPVDKSKKIENDDKTTSDVYVPVGLFVYFQSLCYLGLRKMWIQFVAWVIILVKFNRFFTVNYLVIFLLDLMFQRLAFVQLPYDQDVRSFVLDEFAAKTEPTGYFFVWFMYKFFDKIKIIVKNYLITIWNAVRATALQVEQIRRIFQPNRTAQWTTWSTVWIWCLPPVTRSFIVLCSQNIFLSAFTAMHKELLWFMNSYIDCY